MSLILRLILYLTFSPFIPPQSHFDPGEHPEQAYKEEKGGGGRSLKMNLKTSLSLTAQQNSIIQMDKTGQKNI